MFSFSPLYSSDITMEKRTVEGRHNEVFNGLFCSVIEEEEMEESFRVRGVFAMWLGPKLAWAQSTKANTFTVFLAPMGQLT